jgi:hypothetical protein
MQTLNQNIKNKNLKDGNGQEPRAIPTIEGMWVRNHERVGSFVVL